MAPELLEKRPYRGTSVDIFAAGVVLFVMATGTMPFEKSASVNDGLYQHIVQEDSAAFWTAWSSLHNLQTDSLSPDFKALIVRMLAYTFSDRPTIDQIKEDSWFTKSLPTMQQLKAELIKIRMISVNRRIAEEIKPHIR